MPWADRLREAAYTSPSGQRLTFQYEDVSATVDKNGSTYNFPDADGTFVQDLGSSGRRYPLRVIFWGDDYDLAAAAFDAILLERGPGRLEHPAYGVKTVVPFGAINRRDDLKTAANQAIIELTFWETNDLLYPTSKTDPASIVLAAIEAFNIASAMQFSESVDASTSLQREIVKNELSESVGSVASELEAVVEEDPTLISRFNAIKSSIDSNIQKFNDVKSNVESKIDEVNKLVTLARQAKRLIQTPARAIASINSKLNGYNNLHGSTFRGFDAGSISSSGTAPAPGDSSAAVPAGNRYAATSTNANAANSFRVADLFASTYVSAAVTSTVYNQFLTKPEALESAEEILKQFADLTKWRDDSFEVLAEVDAGGSYQKLQEAVSLAAGFLVEISFSLKQERSITLDKDRTIIDLAAELYGGVDDHIDFLINTNNLSGSEILELPRGRRIVYYL